MANLLKEEWSNLIVQSSWNFMLAGLFVYDDIADNRPSAKASNSSLA
jgi:hypothetical protein